MRKIQRQADTKADRFLSSRSAWDRARLNPDMVRMVISGQDLTYLIVCAYKTRQLSEFICNDKNKNVFAVFFERIMLLGSWDADSGIMAKVICK